MNALLNSLLLLKQLIKVCSFMSFCNTSGFVLHFPNRLFLLLQHPVQTYGYAFLFSLTGYFGISFVLALIKIFGALLAVTGMNKWYFYCLCIKTK